MSEPASGLSATARQRLALARIYVCGLGGFLAATNQLSTHYPAIVVLFVLAAVGLAGRLSALMLGVLLALGLQRDIPFSISDLRDAEALSFINQGILAIILLFLFSFFRAWDAYSLDGLISLYYSGSPDEKTYEQRAAGGVYLTPLFFLSALAVGVLFTLVRREVPIYWIIPLLVWPFLPLEKLLSALALQIRKSLYPETDRLVIFDGDCGFCTRTIMVIERLDVFRLLTIVDFRREWDRIHPVYRRELTPEDCEREMYFSDKSGNYGGYYGFRKIAWTLPLLWPLLPMLYFPGVPKIGVAVYKWVAANRFRIRLKNMDQCHR